MRSSQNIIPRIHKAAASKYGALACHPQGDPRPACGPLSFVLNGMTVKGWENRTETALQSSRTNNPKLFLKSYLDFFCFKGANEINEAKYICIIDETIILFIGKSYIAAFS